MLSGKKIILPVLISALILAAIPGPSESATPDSIGIRVISNPNHYSALRWYKDHKFTGSPQASVVDGYDAIRDGRTVYVNVANVIDTDKDGKNDSLFTNIYLISYNQDAQNATVDIFGRILQHWRFNENLTQYIGKCSITATQDCLYDTDCPKKEYCNSTKAKVTRDTKRLADMEDITYSLEKFHTKNGHYPVLASGSYIPNRSLSVWPSWRQNLGAELVMSIPVDPINKLGDCGGANFDQITCWDDNTKSFAIPGATHLPPSSYAYLYSTDVTGSSYNLAIGAESGTISPPGGNFIYKLQ